MPIYEYVCADCETRFEELRPLVSMDDPADCPQGHAGARRVLSTFAAVTKDSFSESSAIGGGCGACAGGCANCACGVN